MKPLKQLLLVLLFLSWGTGLTAYHIIGGEMYYECLGDDPANPGSKLYLITMKVYRDCQGGGQDFDSLPGTEPGTVTVYVGTSPTPLIESFVIPAPTVTVIPPDAGNPCVIVPSNVCVEEGVYIWEMSLPEFGQPLTLVYQRCCRNSTISNILDAFENGATYTIDISPTAFAECNSSPVFNEFPPVVICVDEPLNVDQSASDAEGDQLIYSFCAPLKGGGLYGGGYALDGLYPNPDAPPPYNPVDFVLPNYSELMPMSGDPQITIDPLTGMITGTPNIQGQFVVGICVSEYRNGELLSIVQRDFQFNVTYCEPTVVGGLEGDLIGDTYVYNFCADPTVSIINDSYQSQFIDEYLWQFEVADSIWSFSTVNLDVTFPEPGDYSGIMVLNPGTQCNDTVNIQINVTPPIAVDFAADYDTCIAGPVTFTDLSDSDIIQDWLWGFGDGNTTNDSDPIYDYDDPGLYTISLTVWDTLNCEYSTTGTVNWFPAPRAIIFEPSESVGCPPLEVQFENLSNPIDSTYEITWTFGDDSTSYEFSPSHTYLIPGNFDIFVEVTSPIGCYESAFFPRWIDVDSLPVADFYYTPPSYNSNFNARVEFTDKSRRAAAWDWRFGDYDSTIVQNPVYTFPDTGYVDVQLAITHYYGCVDTIVKVVDIEPKITYFLPNAFTPNNDTRNDEYKGGGYFRGINDFEMTIWDRYGGIVFQTNDPNKGWNGQKDNVGKMAANGVYVCIVRYTGPRGVPHEEKGFATLIR